MKGHPRRILGLVIGLVSLLQGCGDMKDVLSLNFATALGLDYQKGHYIGYLQTVNLSNVAKVEGGYQGEPIMYVAKAVGATPDAALTNILNTSQQEVYLQHVSAILLSENVIKKGYNDIYDSLTRHPEFTFSPWIFGTREPLEKILMVPGFYNMTTLQTIFHKPLDIFKQHSILTPKHMFEINREVFEPNYTTYIPSLKVVPNQWKKNDKKEPKLAYDGAYFIKNQYYKGYYPLNQLKGLKWGLKDTERIHVTTGSITVNVKPSVSIKETKTGLHPALAIIVNGKGVLFEGNDNRVNRLDMVEKEVNSQIKHEISDLYRLGQKNSTDFFNLEHTLYRDDYTSWKLLFGNHQATYPALLGKIQVHISIMNTGTNKNNKLDVKDIQ